MEKRETSGLLVFALGLETQTQTVVTGRPQAGKKELVISAFDVMF